MKKINALPAIICLTISIPVRGTMAVSLQQLVCAGSDVVIAEVISGQGVESGYGKECDLTIPTGGACKMVKLTVKVEELLGELGDSNDLNPTRAHLVPGEILVLVAYVGELLPSPLTENDPTAVSKPQGNRSNTPVTALISQRSFIFSFDRRHPYPPKANQFYSAVFALDQKAIVHQVLSNSGDLPSCPKAMSSSEQ